MKKVISLLAALLFMATMLPASIAEDAEYIPAPYAVEDASKSPDKYFTPVLYENENGPTIGVTLMGVIKIGDMYFKDSDNDKELDVFEDWREAPEARAADLVSKMSLKQQAGFIINNMMANPDVNKLADALDENGNVVLTKVFSGSTINPTRPNEPPFGVEMILDGCRASVIRLFGGVDPALIAYFQNILCQLDEYAALVNGEPNIPHTVISNPIGNGYPGSMGMAAAVMGDLACGGDYSLVYDYASTDRLIWDAMGIDQLYGPQIDLYTDPRWSRNSGTYGEVPEVSAGIADAIVRGYQNGADGVQEGDVVVTVKHFPGDGAAENGFESHGPIGQWRIYATEGSLEKYQLVAFQAAVDAGTGSIMPSYSRPTLDARSAKQTYRGVDMNAEELGNGYNPTIQKTLLRDVMGFKGYITPDSGIINTAFFGMEDATKAERFAAAIAAGTDCTASEWEPQYIIEAVETGLLAKEDLDRANYNRALSMFVMGRFDNPYEDPNAAAEVYAENAAKVAAAAYLANQKSVVLMKNHEDALPLTDTAKKVFVDSYTGRGSNKGTNDGLKAEFAARGFAVVDDYADADIVFLAVAPTANNSTQMAVIDLVDGLDVAERGQDQKKTGETIVCTTVQDIDRIAKIADAVHEKGGKVIASITTGNPWILTNLEPYCDGLIAVSGSSTAAQLDVLTGAYNPTGKLPLTYASCNEVIAVNEVEIDGVTREICVSPNDVPGYDKDLYISADVLAQSPSGSYAYRDADGNFYRAWFGLSY